MKTREHVVIRQCRGIEEFQACVHLQQEVWNVSDAELVPLHMFVVAEKIGGQIIGSFDGDTLIGLVFSIPGNRNGRLYLHSHLLAVRESYRNLGLGRSMKLAQRDDALARGFELMEWTFDPLEIKNAFLNLHRLGAIARRYNSNQYGVSSSPLQGGLPTDRLVAEWWLKSRRVVNLLDHGQPPQVTPEVTLDVPSAIYQWKADPATRDQARAVQSRNRELFLGAFERGLAALDYQLDEPGNGRFIVGRWDENWSYAS